MELEREGPENKDELVVNKDFNAVVDIVAHTHNREEKRREEKRSGRSGSGSFGSWRRFSDATTSCEPTKPLSLKIRGKGGNFFAETILNESSVVIVSLALDSEMDKTRDVMRKASRSSPAKRHFDDQPLRTHHSTNTNDNDNIFSGKFQSPPIDNNEN